MWFMYFTSSWKYRRWVQASERWFTRAIVYFLLGLRHDISVAHVAKVTAIQTVLLYQLVENFLYAGSPLGPGNPGIKQDRVSNSALESMIY